MDPAMVIDLDTTTQEILLAASNHDIAALKPFLRTPGSASVQDPETGFTPLHAAIAACGPARTASAEGDVVAAESNSEAVEKTTENKETNGNEQGQEEEEEEEEIDIEKAKATITELLLSGAIWNDLDANNETPGCLAWRLGQKDLYEMMVEAGVRAEMLLNLMGGYEELDSQDSDEEDEQVEAAAEAAKEGEDSEMVIISEQDVLEKADSEIAPPPPKDVNSADYLASSLTFTPTSLLDSSSNGVMMSWETSIMTLSSTLLAPRAGLRILNIGFGMGIIDRLFRSTHPVAHHIIEAHPSVLAHISSPSHDFSPESTWATEADQDNKIHAGKWQVVLPELIEQNVVFDAIYFDTFGESYSQLKLFFTEYVVALLAPEGRMGFFNGLGADRRVCYDVYTRVVEMDLQEAGFDTQWVDVEVGELGEEGEGEWEGVRRRYWTLDEYRLPICTFLG